MTNDGWSKEWPKNTIWPCGSPSGSKTDPMPKEMLNIKGQYGKFNTEPKEWPTHLTFKDVGKEAFEQQWPDPTPNPTTDPEGFVESLGDKLGWPVHTGIDLGAGDSQTVLTTFEDGVIKHRVVTAEELYKKEYNNKVPPHDPYTNPNAHIYHECACGAILDPGTKSFAALNNAASNAGWKIRWKQSGEGYQAFCVKCGKDVE